VDDAKHRQAGGRAHADDEMGVPRIFGTVEKRCAKSLADGQVGVAAGAWKFGNV
jgi:hypothetical protein